MEPSELDARQILRLLYQKKVLFLATVILITTMIVLVSYLLPKTYEAKSVIYIERNVLNELIKNVTVTPSFEDKIKALSIVMKSRSLILKVMGDLNVDMAGKKPDEVEGMIKNFQEKTEIKIEVNRATQRDTDLFMVTYTDSDPKRAADFINALVRRYIEDNVSLKREEAFGASKFLLDQISSFKLKLDRIEAAIARQRREKNIPEKGTSPEDHLLSLMQKRDELLLHYTENHPEVARLNAEIELARRELKKESRTLGPDPALLDLQRERETTKKIYEDLLATLRRSEVSTQLEVQDKAGAFRILDPAIVPTRPLSPNMLKMILIAIFGGIAAGLSLIVVVDSFDGSVKSVQTLKKMGLPVLAIISTMQTDQESAATRKKDGLVYAIAGLYLVAVLSVAATEAMGLAYVNDFVQGARTEFGKTVKKMWHKS